jgi:hypothetical protein
MGTYSFVFSNLKSWETKELTFAVHFGNHSDDHASAEHLDVLHKNLNSALKNLKNLFSEVRFSVGRQDSHNFTVIKSMNTNVWVVVIETIFIILLACAQIYFIKRILDNKRVV